MAAVERVADPELRSLLQQTVLRSWSDADGLADYLATLEAGALETALASGALGRLVQASPQRAAELAARLPPGHSPSRPSGQLPQSYPSSPGSPPAFPFLKRPSRPT